MAIRFTFTLNDVDAENLLGCITESKCLLIEESMEPSNVAHSWYMSRIEYLDKLKAKLLLNQERVPDMPEHEVGK